MTALVCSEFLIVESVYFALPGKQSFLNKLLGPDIR